jgi:hypothetical protein
MKKTYEAPSLVARGSFGKLTAGWGRWFADQLVGRFLV